MKSYTIKLFQRRTTVTSTGFEPVEALYKGTPLKVVGIINSRPQGLVIAHDDDRYVSILKGHIDEGKIIPAYYWGESKSGLAWAVMEDCSVSQGWDGDAGCARATVNGSISDELVDMVERSQAK